MAEFARLGCESAVLCAPGAASSKTHVISRYGFSPPALGWSEFVTNGNPI
jgi:hypothetical protein